MSEYVKFEDDEAFVNYAVKNQCLLKSDQCVHYDFEFTEDYLRDCKDGKIFIINDDFSIIARRKAITILGNTKAIDAIVMTAEASTMLSCCMLPRQSSFLAIPNPFISLKDVLAYASIKGYEVVSEYVNVEKKKDIKGTKIVMARYDKLLWQGTTCCIPGDNNEPIMAFALTEWFYRIKSNPDKNFLLIFNDLFKPDIPENDDYNKEIERLLYRFVKDDVRKSSNICLMATSSVSYHPKNKDLLSMVDFRGLNIFY